MTSKNIMKKALGTLWEQLPLVLRAHHQDKPNKDIGVLDIEYPHFMQHYLNILQLFGALINQRGKAIPTEVTKHMDTHIQFWERTLRFPDGKMIVFKSHWVHVGGNELIEYVNPFLGLRMAVNVGNGKLCYQGRYYVVKLGKLLIPIPEWLVLGHTTIEEIALNDSHFAMDFRLIHPLFGQLFRYAGRFRTKQVQTHL